MDRQSSETLVLGFLGIVLVAMVVQAFIPARAPGAARPQPDAPVEACVGEPIAIDYPYEGMSVDPHTCKVQCEDGKQRYILYTNGKATPCERVPGCLDYGEDRGITCTPPTKTPITPKS